MCNVVHAYCEDVQLYVYFMNMYVYMNCVGIDVTVYSVHIDVHVCFKSSYLDGICLISIVVCVLYWLLMFMWMLIFAYVTLHHKMSHNMPGDQFHVFFYFLKSKFYAIYNGETHFQLSLLVAELRVFEYGSTTFGTFEKTCFKC